jgi:hypothetical protein
LGLGPQSSPARGIFHERGRVMPLDEAKQVLNDWVGLEIADVVQIPWE